MRRRRGPVDVPRLQPLLFQPFEPRTRFSLTETLNEARAVHFPGIAGDIEVRIAAAGPLAFVRANGMGPLAHLVVFHPVLNHPDTPIEVVRFIAKHELTHLVERPRIINGAWETHPAEFWDHEYAVAPERWAAWQWVFGNIGGCLRNRPDGISVTRRWMAIHDRPRRPYTPELPFNGERWDRLCPGYGAQLRLPASWVASPAP
ncbi:MAG: hypothetical protein IT303_05235 [Dehalococcoidia bacterium]|nr:hypothetical protein [Dehalococcoidia bacterium]